MNKAGRVHSKKSRRSSRVFVSYATADRKRALTVCEALERRGADCWLSCRDVQPGENYQEAIVREIRGARAMVLVFSGAANNSDEIKKELSLASRHHVPVMALRIEDVEPSDAFAYELSTRQWIDAFDGWDRSLDSLARRIGEMPGSPPPASAPTPPAPHRTWPTAKRPAVAAAAVVMLFLAIGAGWWLLRPAPAVAHSMIVRLSGFQRLSSDLPESLPDTVRDELTAAFGDQGVVGVSTASAPAPGPAPAYALGGTIRRDGNQIRVITRLTNERSGAALWSITSNYDATRLSTVPRHIAVDAARMARCGLFAASTYRKALPDAVMTDYMQYCQTVAVFPTAPQKGLDSARRVVAAVPDFSWGWSAVTLAAGQSQYLVQPGQRDEIRQIGLDAATKALSLDSRNSEALAMKSMLLNPLDHVGQEKLLQQAIATRPLDCGCEHFLYGLVLENVGRYSDAVEQFRRAADMLALDDSFQAALGDSLTSIGRRDEAKPYFKASIELSRSPDTGNFIAFAEGLETGDYQGSIKALQDPKFDVPAPMRAAFLAAFRALVSGNEDAKAKAVQLLAALPADQQTPWSVKLISALGAHQEALQLLVRHINTRFDWPSTLWYPSARGMLNDPGFSAVAERLGLMKYWRTTRTRPDVCADKSPPPFCRMI